MSFCWTEAEVFTSVVTEVLSMEAAGCTYMLGTTYQTRHSYNTEDQDMCLIMPFKGHNVCGIEYAVLLIAGFAIGG